MAFGLYKKESSQRNGRPVYKQLGSYHEHYLYNEYWRGRDSWVLKMKHEDSPHLRSKSDRDIFPPTNWTVFAWNRKMENGMASWIPDNQLKIVTGAEVTKYKPCQRVTISFDGTPPKGIEDALGNYLPTNSYRNGRTVFRHQDDQNLVLKVVVKNWRVDNGYGQLLIQSNAAGDMNPASDRNNQCNSCGQGGQKMMSWKYMDNVYDNEYYDEDDWIESNKIKMSCLSTEREESIDGAGDVLEAEDSKNIGNHETEESSTGNEESGDWANVEKSELKSGKSIDGTRNKE